MHIAMAFDETYRVPALVTLRSLMAHLSPDVQPVLYLLHRGLTDATLRQVRDLIEVRPIATDFGALGRLCAHLHFPPEAAAPIILGEVLGPEVDRVLFLDADLLVVGDVSPLGRVDLYARPFGAVQDMAVPYLGSARGVPRPMLGSADPASPYFNAGVMVIDLDAWRGANPLPALLQYMERRGTGLDLFHQEALNAICHRDWTPLDACWNLVGGLYGRSFDPKTGLGRAEPVIVHFSGRMKPWRFEIAGPFNARYQQHLRPVLDANPDRTDQWSGKTHPMSMYDRYLRPIAYPLERFLWKHRLL